MSKGAASISIILALVLGFVVGSITTQSSRGPNVTTEQAANNNNGPSQAPSERIPVGNSPTLGPANALVTIVEFSDFQCPFCTRVEPTLAAIRQRYGNDVRIVWKNNPLPMHSDAPLAAEAAMEAHRQNPAKFWEMHALLYQNQRALARADLERYAEQLHLNMGEFRQALDSRRHQASVRADMALATSLHADGTPNFFINGTNVVGAVPVERFTAVIDAVLARARTITPRNQVYAQMTANPIAAPGEQPAPNRPNQPARPPQPQLDPSTVYRVPVGNSPTLGPADALVTVVVFSEFQCPYCSRVEPTLATLRERYGADIRFVWKNMPLDFHNNAMPAAEAAMEVFAQQGSQGFWRYHDTLFQNQSALGREDLERHAQAQGVNMARFRAALDGHTHQARVREDMQLAQSVAANGTPHFFINGRRLSGARPVDQFAAVVDETRTAAQALLRTPGVTRANVYERLIANAATAPVYLPTPAGQPGAAPGGNPEDRVFTIRPNPSAPFHGGANARVVLEHFSDYQCPFCSRVNPQFAQIQQVYGDRVRINWRDYPLPMHDNAMPAAEACREAMAQQGNNGFWRCHDLLFQNQQALTRADLERYAGQLGLDMTRFRAALDDHRHQAVIRQDMAALDATGEGGTPASFINGHFVSGAQPFENFQRVIDAQLAAVGGGARPGAAPGGAPGAAPRPAPAAAPAPAPAH